MKKEIKERIEQLQSLEQNLQYTLMQKQTIQTQLIEIDSAISALETNPKNTFKIVGAIMIEASAEDLKKELRSKKELAEVKFKSIEKQETRLKESVKEIQKEVMDKIGKNE